MSDEDELMDYASNKLEPILAPMINEVLSNKPDNVIEFMLDHLRQLRTEGGNDEDTASSGSTLPRMTIEGAPKGRGKGDRRRVGVSAETVDVDELAKTPTRVIPKTEADEEHIRKAVANNILFMSLDDEQMKVVIDAMQAFNFKPGEVIIKQGDPGDDFYSLEEGEAECFVDFKDGAPFPGKCVKLYEAGESFGELALMYGTPRAASILAKTECKLWAMDRTTFRKVLLTSTQAKRKKYEEFLKKVACLEKLDNYERGTVADALVEQTFVDGQYIINEGDIGDAFYILVKGEAKAMKVLDNDQPAIEVKQYEAGEFFGELALMTAAPRAASIVAIGDCTCVSLTKSSFTRVMGPVEDILAREKEEYQKADVVVRASMVAQRQSLIPAAAEPAAAE